jgi:hypothetical protein
MAILITTEVPRQTKEDYVGTIGVLGIAMRQAPGFILQAGYATPDGVGHLIEVWESAEDANRFLAKLLHPHVPPGFTPKRTIYDLHNVLLTLPLERVK